MSPRLRGMISEPLVFFFNDTATTEIYTLSLHDALPICLNLDAMTPPIELDHAVERSRIQKHGAGGKLLAAHRVRSEEHTSELQSRQYLVCRLLLEKKKILDPQTP